MNFAPDHVRLSFFSGVQPGSTLLCRPCDSKSWNLNKTSVREKSRGVYLPIGWVFPKLFDDLWLVLNVRRLCVVVVVLSVPRNSCVIVWFCHVWPAEILFWKSNIYIRRYDQLWFGLLIFWIDRVHFLLRIGVRCASFAGADALLKGRKSSKCKKYLCKLKNTEKSIFFSVKPNFKSDIQNIFNRLLHFHARQIDQRLPGFSSTE